MIDLTALRRRRARIVEAERAYRDAVARTLPVGTFIYYSHGVHEIRATVVEHLGWGRLRVEGCTGKQYILGAERVERALAPYRGE